MQKPINTLIGLLVLVGVGYYAYSLFAGQQGVANLCALYAPGTPIEGIERAAEAHGGKYMGVIGKDADQGTETVVICAPLSMCDVSCMLEIKDGVVVSADVESR